VWIYAITGRVSAASLGRLRGVGGGPVRAIAAGELTAVVEDVGLAEFGEQALRRRLEDLAWLGATARAHHQVIGALAELGPLVPIRLATVYSSDDGVAAMLADRDADFRAALSRIHRRQEWGVKAYAADRPEPQDAAAGAEAPASGGTGAGAAYLQRRRGQLTAQKNARRQMLADAETIHAGLSEHAADARLHPPQAPELAGTKALMILNAAYLVDDDRGREFASVVTALAGRYPGVKLELTGPWPPYSFAANDESEGVSERALRIGTRDTVRGGAGGRDRGRQPRPPARRAHYPGRTDRPGRSARPGAGGRGGRGGRGHAVDRGRRHGHGLAASPCHLGQRTGRIR
jgi:hypothetical protein